MKNIKAFPPNYAELIRHFPSIIGRPGVLYAWGDRLYNPSGIFVPAHLLAHEEVHGRRQTDPALWWAKYVADRNFRLQEEIIAHRAEWRFFREHEPNAEKAERYLRAIAARLSGPLYNDMVPFHEALREIDK